MTHQWLEPLKVFSIEFEGDLHLDFHYRSLFATDASVYSEIPRAVAIVFDQKQLKQVVDFCIHNFIPIIPRGAGTSLGGQVVGNGLILDTSHLKTIDKLNVEECWIDVEPGVVLDELNLFLKPHNLFFGPETSTSSRCTIGGMVGNNSCGARSLVYGSTRDQLLAVDGFLSDGSEVVFGSLANSECALKLQLQSLEGSIYRGIYQLLDSSEVRDEITAQYPHSSIHRRNGGYALDTLVQSQWFSPEGIKKLNIANIIAGSEGTLMVFKSLRLHLHLLPPKCNALIVAHFNSLDEALHANMFVLQFNPRAVELMDKTVLDLTKDNREQQNNRFFIKDNPQALLIVEVGAESDDEVTKLVNSVVDGLLQKGFGYHSAVVKGSDIQRVWSLRKAGLGVLSNMVGDAKPVSVIEDCAVRVEDLPQFCIDVETLLSKYNKKCVFHGHAGSGELHLRPILNLKDKADVELFRLIGRETALLVKKYGGSLSGEHGDGRVRGEFIPLMIGAKNYELLIKIKQLFDPNNILNPNKIIDTPPMNSSLRYDMDDVLLDVTPVFDWTNDGSFLSAVERCNGSGDCLKSSLLKGVMCPSYQATRNELFSPRGRANLVRLFLSKTNDSSTPLLEELVSSLQLCLSCKACKSECPSNVDVAKFKGEIMALYYSKKHRSLRNLLFANFGRLSGLASNFPRLCNAVIASKFGSLSLSWLFQITNKRSLPKLSSKSLVTKGKLLFDRVMKSDSKIKMVVLFNDEFTNYYNSEVGAKAMKLLNALGYEVVLFTVNSCGRTHLSMGDAVKAKKIINDLLVEMTIYVKDALPIIGLEPSAILTFRDEALSLALSENVELAKQLAAQCVTLEEFISSEMDCGHITSSQFTKDAKSISFHGHCYQKALEKPNVIKKILSLPVNYNVVEINSGCCGMGGAFGYEEEHYDVSLEIGELVLLPAIRKLPTSTIVSTSGFSCKHQIEDFTGRNVMHPAEILFEALLEC